VFKWNPGAATDGRDHDKMRKPSYAKASEGEGGD